jgi:ribosomal protein S18 acetylase RimI-like enzyme
VNIASSGGTEFGPLLDSLAALEGLDVRLGGGWGIDVLAGRVTREHHDVDLFVPQEHLPEAAGRFRRAGFRLIVDEPPTRQVLEAPGGRRVDLNGIVYRDGGHAVQADAGGDMELFPSWGWTQRRIGGRTVVCLTAEAQRSKHRGYPPRPQDAADLDSIAGISEPSRFDRRVRRMEPGEDDLIDAIETASDRLLEPFGLWPLPASKPDAKAREQARTFATLVVGRPPVGFARLEQVDGHAHIGQLSVLPEYGGLGLGRDLVEASCRLAEERGDAVITLTTFAEVPFNAPWYRRLGFADLSGPLTGELGTVLADESDLTSYGTRLVMGRPLGRAG